MSKFIIEGLAPLAGEIEVKGAKNAALKIIPAAMLATGTVRIGRLPQVEDVRRSLEIAVDLGAEVSRGQTDVDLRYGDIKKTGLDPKYANKLRASIMFVGPLLARAGKAVFPFPGGCAIGAGGRPIDLFLKGFAAFGAKIDHDGAYYRLSVSSLKAASFFFPVISVTATEAMMMTAVLAKGKTVLRNCAHEPEIEALADFLNSGGARIRGAGTPTITVDGVDEIQGGRFTVMPDRIEAGTLAIMAAATRSELTIKNFMPAHNEALLEIFKDIGVIYDCGPDWLAIKPGNIIKAADIKTHEYPGFPTDLQSPFTVLMTQAQGSSLIHETIYDRRLLYVDMLMQMGADIIMCDPHRVVVNGPTRLRGKRLTSPDLRAGIAMIIAALVAEGQTEIDNIYQIDRGYEDIDGRLRALGAKIKRIGTLNIP